MPVIALLGLASPVAASAADRITIIVGGMEKQVYLPAMLTERLGYFKGEGLDVEPISTRSGVAAQQRGEPGRPLKTVLDGWNPYVPIALCQPERR